MTVDQLIDMLKHKGQNIAIMHFHRVLITHTFTTEDQIRILIYVEEVNKFLHTKALSPQYAIELDPTRVDSIYKIMDTWEDAWIHCMTRYELPYRGFNLMLENLGKIVA